MEYDRQLDIETETESLRRYDPTTLHIDNCIERCENAIQGFKNAIADLDEADEEILGLLNIRNEGVKLIKQFIQTEIDNLKREKERYEEGL